MFGYGHGTTVSHTGEIAREIRADGSQGGRVAKTFTRDMCAHVWAQRRQTFGQNGKGTLFFRGRALYSYGTHYCVGFILPEAGQSFDSASVGVTLVNSEENSVTTNRHRVDAYSFARGRALYVPRLTELSRILNHGVGQYYGESTIKAARAIFADSSYLEFSDVELIAKAAPAIFRALGDSERDAGRRARGLDSELRRNIRNREERARKAEHESHLRTLAKRTAALTPASVAAAILADARSNGTAGLESSDAEYWRDLSRELFRAIKAGKASGRSGQVRKAQAIRKAIRDSMPLFESYATLAARVGHWQTHKATLRNALASRHGEAGAASDTESRYRGRGLPNVTGLGHLARNLRDGAEAARTLAAYVARPEGDTRPAFASTAARVSGFAPDALAARLRALALDLKRLAERAEVRDRRQRARAEVSALRSALAAVGRVPDALDALDALPAYAETLRAGFDVAEKYAGRVPYSWERDKATVDGLLPPHASTPGAWRCGGFTPSHFRRVARLLKSACSDVKGRLERLAREERGAARAIAREAWRDGREGELPCEIRTLVPRDCEDGGAMLRAEGVTRTPEGGITGGTLHTSQGASVPLLHALRAFAFLRYCRERGEREADFDGWKANGRTLRVGHFRVDSVDSAGNFRAGCHAIRYAECARLAERLGVADIAPAITTETRETA